MKKEKKSESIADELLFIKNSLIILSDENSENKKAVLEESTKKFDDILKFFHGLRKLTFFLLITVVILAILLIVSLYYVKKTQNLNSEIEDIRTDTIANQILEVKRIMLPDSTYETTYNYRTRNNKIVSYNQLLKENDSLEKIILSKTLNINSLQNDISRLEDENSTFQNQIDLAKRQYGIRFWMTYEMEKKKKTEYINIESKKLDSALILLEVYRNKLFYNKETKKWQIK